MKGACVKPGTARAAPDTSWTPERRVFDGPVYLLRGTLVDPGHPHRRRRRAPAGWSHAYTPSEGWAWWTVLVRFDGTVADLDLLIWRWILATGDTHHIAFETLDLCDPVEGLPVYRVGMAS